ncbi:MAG: DUF4158 domain-containing protein [Blastocatellia bacterium]
MTLALSFPRPEAPGRVLNQRSGLDRLPRDLSRAELFRYFTYSEGDIAQIHFCRGDQNRVGFALMLGGVRLTGRFPFDLDRVSSSLITHVSRQLQMKAPEDFEYTNRRATRHKHIDRLKAYLGLRNFTETDNDLVENHVRDQILSGASFQGLIASCEQVLRENRILLPAVSLLERWISTARLTAEDQLYTNLTKRVSAKQAASILGLLAPVEGTDQTRLQALQQSTTRVSPKGLDSELSALDVVQRLLPSSLDLNDLHLRLVERCARLVSGGRISSLRRFTRAKRLSALLCWLWRLRSQLLDESLTIGNDLIAGVFRRARNSAELEQKRQRNKSRVVAVACRDVFTVVLDEDVPDESGRQQIFKRVPRDQMPSLLTDCNDLAGPSDRILTNELRKRYSYVRQFAPRLIDAFELRSTTTDVSLLKAISYLRLRNRFGERGLGKNTPLDFVPPAWKPYVCPAPGVIDRALWERCLLDRMRQALKSGNISVPHSRTFQSLDSYLIPGEEWQSHRDSIAGQHSIPLQFEPHWQRLELLLKEQLRASGRARTH